jgi:hypothetical protein
MPVNIHDTAWRVKDYAAGQSGRLKDEQNAHERARVVVIHAASGHD